MYESASPKKGIFLMETNDNSSSIKVMIFCKPAVSSRGVGRNPNREELWALGPQKQANAFEYDTLKALGWLGHYSSDEEERSVFDPTDTPLPMVVVFNDSNDPNRNPKILSTVCLAREGYVTHNLAVAHQEQCEHPLLTPDRAEQTLSLLIGDNELDAALKRALEEALIQNPELLSGDNPRQCFEDLRRRLFSEKVLEPIDDNTDNPKKKVTSPLRAII
jgi:hypothetical protein